MPASRPGARASANGSAARTTLIPILAGLLHAVFMAAAFPPVGFWPASFLAVLPLALIAGSGCCTNQSKTNTPRRSIFRTLRTPLLVTLGVLPVHFYEHQWLINVSALGYVPFAIGMSLFPGAFVWLLERTAHRFPWAPLSLVVPVVWTGLEVFRGEITFTGYPWLLLAHPLIDAPKLAAPAAVLGTYFVTFLAAIPAGLITQFVVAAPRRALNLAPAAALLLAGFLLVPLLGPHPAPSDATFRIAVVQTNVPQDNKLDWTIDQRAADFDRFLELTRQAAAARPDLIVWPETMFPGLFLDPAGMKSVADAQARTGRSLEGLTYFTTRLLQAQHELSIPMLVGAVGFDNPRLVGPPDDLELDQDARFNSVFLIDRGKVDPLRYDKIGLTPFGEVMPYVHIWPWLQKQVMAVAAHGMAFDLTAGSRPRIFQIAAAASNRPGASIATPICFEATKPGLCRRLLKGQADHPRILVNLTNDGWFGAFNPTRLQHLQIARWRAVELATPVIRAANTGISTWIDARGRVLKQGVESNTRGARVDGILIADPHPGRINTIYSRIGDVFGWSTMWLTLALAIVSFVKPGPGRGPTIGDVPTVPESSKPPAARKTPD